VSLFPKYVPDSLRFTVVTGLLQVKIIVFTNFPRLVSVEPILFTRSVVPAGKLASVAVLKLIKSSGALNEKEFLLKETLVPEFITPTSCEVKLTSTCGPLMDTTVTAPVTGRPDAIDPTGTPYGGVFNTRRS
jgi:hypothetical protein